MMKTYNQPQTLVTAIVYHQGICQVASPAVGIEIIAPTEYGDGSGAN